MLNTLAFETWKRASENLISIYQLRLNKVLHQQAKYLAFINDSHYEIETVSHVKDLYALLKMRRNLEQSNNKLRIGLSEFALTDNCDVNADHIVIRDVKTKNIVGGFRLLSSPHAKTFFNESIFNLDSLKAACDSILELSRLFLLPEHKHKDLMILVARFLSQYSLLSKSDIIISNQSINSGASRNAALVNQYFNTVGLHNPHIQCSVQQSHHIPNYQHWTAYFKNGLNNLEIAEGAGLLPQIFKDSLNIGVTIAAPPGLDRITNRIDFLTILHKEDLNRALWKKSFSHFESSCGSLYSSR